MYSADVIILSNTANEAYYGMTQRAISSLRSSEPDVMFDVKLVESNKEAASMGFLYPDCHVIVPDEKFHYNKFLNHALKHCSKEWLVVSNNDVIYTPGWFTNMMSFHQRNPDVKSMCPFEPSWHSARGFDPNSAECFYGYRTSFELAGWCIVSHREIVERCELFDPQFAFIYQDNDYAETIRNAGYKHALLSRSVVHHITFQSNHLVAHEDLDEMFGLPAKLFATKWPSVGN